MNESIDLNTKQLTLVMVNLITTKMFFAFPRFLFRTSGNAAWIQAIYMSLIAYALFAISISFYKACGNKSIIQLAESIGKAPFKIFVTALVAIIIVANVGTEMRTFAESVKIVLLPRTDMEYIMLLFGITVAVGAYCGFPALSVINSLFFPLCLLSLAVLALGLVPSYSINNLFPILGNGAKSIFVGGLADMYGFTDLLALNLLLPYCKNIEMAKKSGKSAIIISGGVLLVICLAYGLTYPYPYSSEFLLIPYQLTRMVRAGEYFQRFEALFEFIWSVTQLLYSSIYVAILCRVFQNTFKLKFSKPLIGSVIAIISLISFKPSSVVELLESAYGFRQTLIPVAYLLPILVPALYLIKRRKKNER